MHPAPLLSRAIAEQRSTGAMAATPEEFAAQGLLGRPEPPSPCAFHDLPPAPRGCGGAFDDLALPYIARLLMEDDIEDQCFYQYPDHPALLQAQLPFAQILTASSTISPSASSYSATAAASSGSSTSTISPSLSSCDAATASSGSSTSKISSDAAATASPHSAPGDGEWRRAGHGELWLLQPGDQAMLNSAFLKGVEEANKFLPTGTNLSIHTTFSLKEDGGRQKRRHNVVEAGRAGKLMMPALEEDGARELLDEMLLQEHHMCMKGVQDLSVDGDNQPKKNGRKGPRRQSDGEVVDLHALLLHCAQAVSTDDRRTATELLKRIKRSSSPKGDAQQRLAHYFAEGLEARLAGTGSELYRSQMTKPTMAVDFLKAQQLLMVACCCRLVSFTFSNKTIYDAAAGRSRLHIVDYGLNFGFQWPGLLRALAAREGGPPEVRITGIDLPQPGFRGDFHIEETGRKLSSCARLFGVPFRFRAIGAKRETVRPEDLNIDQDEVLIVISLCHFKNLMDENLVSEGPTPRDQVLNNIRNMRPDVFIHGVQNGSYGATYFLTRFREALFHYSAQFDLLDATVPRISHERMLLERDIIGLSALNVIACEGADRVERPERYKNWTLRNHRARLKQLPLVPEVVKLVLEKVKDNYHKDFVVHEDQQWLVHRWRGRVLYAISAWVADDVI